MEIPIGIPGLIISGDEVGWTVEIKYDTQKTGGYYIFTSRDSEGYDDWVPDYKSLEKYFEESKWLIKWGPVPPRV
ncbi:hypothetical protein [Propionibacterium acidifaciens]|uniref:hypothetical protein n=1 Tax=Propionibacterium acidifaciens TaxID=556499 RepID=UPI0012DC31E4|nr:hypothetical protein [Propionibacterium acidifaciens]